MGSSINRKSAEQRVQKLLGRARDGRILSVERTRSGFRVHVEAGEPPAVRVPRSQRRIVELQLRRRGLLIVDEWGARIDQSQFDKEADPGFNSKRDPRYVSAWEFFLPLFVLDWRMRRNMRRSSDDA